ncbi:MAG: hypothetical protein E6J82_19025 [Deltaproteobacteria bacterium]|nr:MAG: hypothetical protein E6J82_19025 [Deltaproteobacteria bacterium]
MSETTSGVGTVQRASAPWFTSSQLLPSSFERQTPKCGAPGTNASVPPQHVFEMPRVARPVATNTVFESPCFTAIDPTPRPKNWAAPSGPRQPLRPSFDW